MPSDIRSFFGGGGSVKPAESAAKKDLNGSKSAKKHRGRKVISDEEDDDEIETKPATRKKVTTPKAKKVVREEPKVEETTSTDYFATTSKAKSAKSTPVRAKATTTNGGSTTPSKEPTDVIPSTGRRAARKIPSRNYIEDSENDAVALVKDDDEGHDDIFVDDFRNRRAADDYEEGTDEENVKTPARKITANGQAQKHESEDNDEDMEMAEIPTNDGHGTPKRKRSSTKAAPGRKRKSKELDEDENFVIEDDDDISKTARKPAAPAPKKPRATAKKEEKEESKEIRDILESVPTIRPPTPPPMDEGRKFVFGGGNAAAAPIAAGSKQIPEGADNCLAGLNFVFTGVLESLGREEAQNVVKRYGGKVTGAPSKKTNYVVVGADAGPRKLQTIRDLGITTINEEGLFHLIRHLPAGGGDSKAAEAAAQKAAKEEAKIRKEAEGMEERERQREKDAARAAQVAAGRTSTPSKPGPPPKPKVDDRLWVDKYAPDSISSVCGNKAQVEGLQRWLRNWHNSARSGFKKAGPDGKGIFRAAMLHGPPGVGKTTAAHLVAKLEGYDVVESNASDTRSKKLVESGLTGVLDTTSLLGYFAGDGKKVNPAQKKLLLIMDEVDGMSAGDRGGVGALAAVAKKTHIPMILICNERRLPKMKPFDFVTADFAFRRPTVDMIRGRIATICYREGMKLPLPVINALIEGCNGDIRQIINMISTLKLDDKDLDFKDSKAMSKAWEKHVILKPWDIVTKILRPQMFAPSSTATLNDKIELYFNDHEFSYLMLQENYLKTQPSLAGNYSGKERNLKWLELAEKAAASISDGDLVDRMIHGAQQQWSLMPVHAIFSFVRPASYVYGNFHAQVGFAGWLGQNSKQGKLSRYIKEIQGHMRLRASGDRHEVRQQYLPALWNKTVAVLQAQGKESVQDVIDFMDSYYLTKDDFDSMVELGVGPMAMEKVKLDTQTKATFTRLYNSESHPMPFMKASSVVGVGKAGGVRHEKPDLEEAVDESDEEDIMLDVEAVEDAEDEELDLKKDKYVKVPKKRAVSKTGASKAKGGGKGKRKKVDIEDDAVPDESGEETKPSKRKAAASGRKGKGKV